MAKNFPTFEQVCHAKVLLREGLTISKIKDLTGLRWHNIHGIMTDPDYKVPEPIVVRTKLKRRLSIADAWWASVMYDDGYHPRCISEALRCTVSAVYEAVSPERRRETRRALGSLSPAQDYATIIMLARDERIARAQREKDQCVTSDLCCSEPFSPLASVLL